MTSNFTIFFECLNGKYVKGVILFMGANKTFFNFRGPIFSVSMKPEDCRVKCSSQHMQKSFTIRSQAWLEACIQFDVLPFECYCLDKKSSSQSLGFFSSCNVFHFIKEGDHRKTLNPIKFSEVQNFFLKITFSIVHRPKK